MHDANQTELDQTSDVATIASGMPKESFAWLAGRRICMVGKSGGMIKKEWRQFAKNSGGLVVSEKDPDVSLVVIGADSFPFDLSSLSNHLKSRIESGQAELVEETVFWQKCGQLESSDHLSRLYTPAMLADLIGVRSSQIRRWHRRGLIRPVCKIHRLPYFDFQEIATARKLVSWLDHQSADQIEKKLTELAKLVPSANRSLSQLPIIVEGKEVFLREIGGFVEPSGQKLFDFHYDDFPETSSNSSKSLLDGAAPDSLPVSIPISKFESLEGDESFTSSIPFSSKTSDQLLYDALEYEEAGRWDEAIAIYRAVILADGLTADLSFQIAELLYRKGDLDGARERYFVAIEIDENFVEARANLGCVLCELDQWELAVSVFEGALAIHPDYADVIFHLASCLDKLDRKEEANPYWSRFLEQAPNSPWAAYAEARIGSIKK